MTDAKQPDLRRLVRLLFGVLVGGLAAMGLLLASRSGSWGRLLWTASTAPTKPENLPDEDLDQPETEGASKRVERKELGEDTPWLEGVALTNQGCVREENQDNYELTTILDGKAVFALVADGMGGHQGGSVASDIAVSTIAGLVKKLETSDPKTVQQILSDSLSRADDAIRHRASKESTLAGMGTTAVGAVVTPDIAIHAYTGDSRLYHFRKGEQIYRTRDHSVVRYLMEEGLVTEEEARVHPMRSRLTSSLGGSPPERKVLVEPEWDDSKGEEQPCVRELRQGDVLVLCSDGLNGEIEPHELDQIVAANFENIKEMTQKLLNAALEAGGRDNVTIIVLRRV